MNTVRYEYKISDGWVGSVHLLNWFRKNLSMSGLKAVYYREHDVSPSLSKGIVKLPTSKILLVFNNHKIELLNTEYIELTKTAKQEVI